MFRIKYVTTVTNVGSNTPDTPSITASRSFEVYASTAAITSFTQACGTLLRFAAVLYAPKMGLTRALVAEQVLPPTKKGNTEQ